MLVIFSPVSGRKMDVLKSFYDNFDCALSLQSSYRAKYRKNLELCSTWIDTTILM